MKVGLRQKQLVGDQVGWQKLLDFRGELDENHSRLAGPVNLTLDTFHEVFAEDDGPACAYSCSFEDFVFGDCTLDGSARRVEAED